MKNTKFDPRTQAQIDAGQTIEEAAEWPVEGAQIHNVEKPVEEPIVETPVVETPAEEPVEQPTETVEEEK
jgi:hypothetical protein